jgi:hypothetical protein
MHNYAVTSGFLIMKTFARMCREYLVILEYRTDLVGKGGYSAPRSDIPPEEMLKQYRGLHREPIQAWVETLRGSGIVEPTDQELAASIFLDELHTAGKAGDDFISAIEDAKKLVAMIVPPVEREIIWARCVDEGYPPPPTMDEDDPILSETAFLGYDLSAFYPPECNSAIAESMFFVYWFADDEKRVRFKAHHEKLNRWGLFGTPGDAEQFLKAYRAALPLDADERHYGHRIVEVRGLT